MKLGFFDSGLGGLLMMQSCMKQHPQYDYVYIGDTKNLPYGPRSAPDIAGYMEPYVLYLLQKEKCDYVVIACNTASVRALPLFLEKYPQYEKQIINIIQPTLDFLRDISSELSDMLILATQGTVTSNIYAHRENLNIHQIAMPGLVGLIELGKKQEALTMMDDALSYHPNIKHVLLGCTHYVWLQSDVEMAYPNISFIGQDVILNALFEGKDVNNKNKQGIATYYVSDAESEYTERYRLPFKKLQL